ncbi:MAG TPA: ABC transporter ATP-binding protein [Ktedonobacteraceae bacterium]|nr:ABC transporter ATP-binding protein [Ktedonobacteraceae bacterium]
MTLSLKRYRNLLVTYFLPQWALALLLFILLFANIGLSLANPQILSSFIDGVSAGEPLQALLNAALLFLAIACLAQIFSVIESYVAENLGQITTNKLRADLTLHCLQLDPAFHTAHTPGELIERVDGDVAKLGNFFSRFAVAILGNAFLLVGVLVMLFRIDWRVGTVLTFFAIVSLLIISKLRNLATPYWEKERQASAELFGFLEERLSGTEDIRSSGATTYMIRGLAQHTRAVLHRLITAAQINFATWGSMTFLFTLGTAIALALGIYLFTTHAITIGVVYLIFSYATLLARPIQQIVQQLRDLQETTGSIVRIFALLDMHSTIQDGIGTPVPAGPLSAEFADVSFSYVDDLLVLKHIDFSLKPGIVMGLLGRTGSGKSTLSKLLVRLYDPQAGAVRLGGIDLRDMRLEDLREHIGMVTQDVHILHATVRDNLTLFDASIPDERIIQALEDLGLGEWYLSLPEGLDTRLAPGGSGLSAGEAQLVSFARVFLKDPGLVILDEASSRLDPATERQLEHAIDRLLAGRTGIIIAHRLATVLRTDIIMILENGTCCEYGRREELERNPDSRFAHLLRTGLEEALV